MVQLCRIGLQTNRLQSPFFSFFFFFYLYIFLNSSNQRKFRLIQSNLADMIQTPCLYTRCAPIQHNPDASANSGKAEVIQRLDRLQKERNVSYRALKRRKATFIFILLTRSCLLDFTGCEKGIVLSINQTVRAGKRETGDRH